MSWDYTVYVRAPKLKRSAVVAAAEQLAGAPLATSTLARATHPQPAAG
jgi:hypothetical protein